jgi:hypothetical protein
MDSKLKDYVKSRFNDADVDKSGYLEFSEVKVLFRNVVRLLVDDEEDIIDVSDTYIMSFKTDMGDTQPRLSEAEFVELFKTIKANEDAITALYGGGEEEEEEEEEEEDDEEE